MLGSHDTFTYLKTSNIIAKASTAFWRCQEKSIQDQYKFGVRLFDVRVINEDKNEFSWWRIGHGFAKVEQRFVNLKNICIYFQKEFPGSIIRICLESGCSDEKIVEQFKKEAADVFENYKDMIYTINIKKPWVDLYVGKRFKKTEYYACHLFNWNLEKSILENLKTFDMSAGSIKSWAKKHNPDKITKEMKDDPDTLYFLDYVGVYPSK